VERLLHRVDRIGGREKVGNLLLGEEERADVRILPEVLDDRVPWRAASVAGETRSEAVKPTIYFEYAMDCTFGMTACRGMP
jgi:hypothetical protein